MRAEIRQNVRFNFTVNVLDGAFFGFGLGIASYVTVIPLFVSTLTDSSALIGLIAAMHMIGWQLPQLLTANRVARMRRFKPMVMLMTLNERLPFFALTLVALALPTIGKEWGLLLTFIFVIWQASGGGFTGTAWQSLIGKIMPQDWRGTFYGVQSSAANLLGSGGAILAGVILKTIEAPQSFALCFFICGAGMMISLAFLGSTREPESPPAREQSRSISEFWQGISKIIRGDSNLRLFILARSAAQISSVGFAFFTIYATRFHGMDAGTAGIMTGVLMLTQTVANPIVGWLGDRTSHRIIFALGAVMAGSSALIALLAPSLGWFYLVFAMTGAAGAALWTTVNALTYDFGPPEDRPYYIGLINTLVAPAALIAPLAGGWLADNVGYSATFIIAAVSGILTAVLVTGIREPRVHYAVAPVTPATTLIE